MNLEEETSQNESKAMKLLCDVCQAAAASVACFADQGVTCASCDARVHAANKLVTKHQRAPLLDTSAPAAADQPTPHQLCDICQERSAFFFCVEDRAVLCRYCDVSIHTANPASAKHRRYLLTGIQVDLQAVVFSPPCNQISTNNNNNNGGNSSRSAIKQNTARAGPAALLSSSVNTVAAPYPASATTMKALKPLNSQNSLAFAAKNGSAVDKSFQKQSVVQLTSATATGDQKLSGNVNDKFVLEKSNNSVMKTRSRNWMINEMGDNNEHGLVNKSRQGAGSVYEKLQNVINAGDRIKRTPKAQIYMQRLQSTGGVPFIAPTLSNLSGRISAFEANDGEKNNKKPVISVNEDTQSGSMVCVPDLSPKNSDHHVNSFGTAADQSISSSTCCSSSNSESLQLMDIVPDLYEGDAGSNHYNKMLKMTEPLGDVFGSNLEYGEAEVPEMSFSHLPAGGGRRNNLDSCMNFMKDAEQIELDVESWDFDYLFSDLPNPASYHSYHPEMDDVSVVPDILTTTTTNPSFNYLKKRKKSFV